MIKANQNKIADSKIKNKPGGGANESRFFTTERELRTRKVIIVPSVNTNGIIKMEQAWNKRSKYKDVVKLTINNNSIIVTREELEQGIASLAQGMETIKYQAPKIN